MADLTYENALTNAIGYEMFKDTHEITTRPDGVDQIQISDEDVERCKRAAKRCVEELRGLGALK